MVNVPVESYDPAGVPPSFVRVWCVLGGPEKTIVLSQNFHAKVTIVAPVPRVDADASTTNTVVLPPDDGDTVKLTVGVGTVVVTVDEVVPHFPMSSVTLRTTVKVPTLLYVWDWLTPVELKRETSP